MADECRSRTERRIDLSPRARASEPIPRTPPPPHPRRAQWVDLDGDGANELLVTSQGTDGKGKVLAYERPADWEAGAAWTKHVLADGCV